MRLLIVEDEGGIAGALRQGLSEQGYAVDVARDGEQGRDYALSAPYDVMLLDILLPKLDGLSLLRDLRKRGMTTPFAMVESMLRIFTQDVLTLTSRALLIDWMTASKTGADRVRKGLPRTWVSSDKTGTGANGAFNDLVMTWPLERRPIIIAVYMSGSTQSPTQLAAAHAEIGELVGHEKWK